MSERGKRVFRFLLDPERDADVIGRIEAQQPMTGYVCELVRRDMHDERLDFAALKAAELQTENAKLRHDLEEANNQAEEVCIENAKLRELVRDVVLLAGLNGCDVTEMQMHVHGGDWRTIWERMAELGVDE